MLTGARLHLVGPLGFSLDDQAVRRAGLAYWQSLDLREYASWQDFLAQNPHAMQAFAAGEPLADAPQVHLLTNKYLVGIHLQRDIHLSPHRTDKQKAEDDKQKYFQ